MQQDWQDFLVSKGATLAGSTVESFSQQNDETTTEGHSILCDLSHYAIFRASGSDASNFLQGQLSNDINQVNESRSQLSAYCSPKGRALALLRIIKQGEDYLLILPAEIAEKTINRLKMFILRSDVSIENASDAFFHFGVCGKNASESISAALATKELPTETDQASLLDGTNIIKLAGQPDRYELLGPYSEARSTWEKLQQTAKAAGHASWELQQINAGIPEILTNTSEAFVPQMLNLQLINAVNFKKGCYPGQEIVARTKYLGKLKKRLFLAEIAGNQPLEIGTGIYESGENQQSVGKIVLAAPLTEDTTRILAVLQISSVENQPLSPGQKGGEALKLLELPYSLEE